MVQFFIDHRWNQESIASRLFLLIIKGNNFFGYFFVLVRGGSKNTIPPARGDSKTGIGLFAMMNNMITHKHRENLFCPFLVKKIVHLEKPEYSRSHPCKDHHVWIQPQGKANKWAYDKHHNNALCRRYAYFSWMSMMMMVSLNNRIVFINVFCMIPETV